MKHRKRRHRPSPAVRQACARFGITIRDADAGGVTRERLGELAESLDRTLGPGGIALVTGPSGSGKTRLLRMIRARLLLTRRACVAAGRGRIRRGARVLDAVAGPRGADRRALALLGRAGLAEARVIVARADRLSAGEAWRLELARAMGIAETQNARRSRGHGTGWHGSGARAGPVRQAHGSAQSSGPVPPGTPSDGAIVTMLIDEFGSVLDRHTAAVLARLVRRWARTNSVRVVCATAHDDVLEPLGPDAIVVFDGEGDAQVVARPPESSARRAGR